MKPVAQCSCEGRRSRARAITAAGNSPRSWASRICLTMRTLASLRSGGPSRPAILSAWMPPRPSAGIAHRPQGPKGMPSAVVVKPQEKRYHSQRR